MATERDLTGPFVNLAVLCRKAEPAPGKSISITQVLHRIGVLERPPGRLAPKIDCFVVVSLSSGFALGTFPVRIELIRPGGTVALVFDGPVAFLGEEFGETIVQEVTLVLDEPGVYWFDVLLSERLLSRFPLRVEFLPRAATSV